MIPINCWSRKYALPATIYQRDSYLRDTDSNIELLLVAQPQSDKNKRDGNKGLTANIIQVTECYCMRYAVSFREYIGLFLIHSSHQSGTISLSGDCPQSSLMSESKMMNDFVKGSAVSCYVVF